ncbi:hypothetical protein MSTE_00751 [Mycobacteroides stephanolepidis]|uniref:Uncharacterized protein n=1 Tax=[Mycobacterium] stephanolepidis TaxID=1520670 RepID=A0A1Z4ESZ0_9MYCO|nr:hypothetical protein [[Mycobacterium] stephanolepidis]BAX96086.1 hypothetical protein MSTE_00751 [[Mycobacterium] stephanolepidis]
MAAFNVRFTANPPDGWVSVMPTDAGQPHASVAYVRQADCGGGLVTNISVTEHLLTVPAVDMEEASDRYADYLRSRVHALKMIRSDYISRTAPVEYGQEFEFLLDLGAVLLPVCQTRICIALPLTYASTLIEEIVFTTPQGKARETNVEFVKFLESLNVIGGEG